MWGTRQPAFNCIIWLAREAAHAHSESGGRLAGHVGGRALRCDPRIVLPSRGLDGRLRVPSKTIDEARPHLVFWPRLSQPHLRSHCQLAESSRPELKHCGHGSDCACDHHAYLLLPVCLEKAAPSSISDSGRGRCYWHSRHFGGLVAAMRLGLIAMSGVRAHNPELTALGLTLPGFVERNRVIPAKMAGAEPAAGPRKLAGRVYSEQFTKESPSRFYANYRTKRRIATP